MKAPVLAGAFLLNPSIYNLTPTSMKQGLKFLSRDTYYHPIRVAGSPAIQQNARLVK